MKITSVRIQNFRCIKDISFELATKTVLIGQNNVGKSAVLDAIRLVLGRRWGRRGTGFTEDDIHRATAKHDAKDLEPIIIDLTFTEQSALDWDADMVAAIEDSMNVLPDGRNSLRLRTKYEWSEDDQDFSPSWQFLDINDYPMTGRGQRSTNFNQFFKYVPVYWLGPLRDAATQFTPRAPHWGSLLRKVRIPEEIETEVLEALATLDSKVIESDERLSEIASLIGTATEIAITDSPGAAKLATLPLTIEDMLQRTNVVLQNECERPWLPLAQHGQGLQSLAVIFLFKAFALHEIDEERLPGMSPIFTIEEPEAHLHPQAARTLWAKVCQLPGQIIMTTHSPYFLQNVPIRDIRLLRFRDGVTECHAIPSSQTSQFNWNTDVEKLSQHAGNLFHDESGRVSSQNWFKPNHIQSLANCYKSEGDEDSRMRQAREFHHRCRILPSDRDIQKLGLHGRRIRGEIFFAKRWILVEGHSEYLLVRAIGHALGHPVDTHGIAVIDFRNGDSVGVYAGLAEGLGFGWRMVVDGDSAGRQFIAELRNRGFSEQELRKKVSQLSEGNNLERELLALGHSRLIAKLITDLGCVLGESPTEEVLNEKLAQRKTAFIQLLCDEIEADRDLALQMPQAFLNLFPEGRIGQNDS